MKILTIDTTHHPLTEKDMDDLREEIAKADIVIHTFSPFKHSIVKGAATITDIRQGLPRGWEKVDGRGRVKL